MTIKIREQKYMIGDSPIEVSNGRCRFMIYIRDGPKGNYTHKDPHYFDVDSREYCVAWIKAITKASIQDGVLSTPYPNSL